MRNVNVWLLLLAVPSGIGGVACTLQWLGIQPKDFAAMTIPGLLWLVFAIFLFAVSLGASVRALYVSIAGSRAHDAEIVELKGKLAEETNAKNAREGRYQQLREDRDAVESRLRSDVDRLNQHRVELLGTIGDLKSRVAQCQPALDRVSLLQEQLKDLSAKQFTIEHVRSVGRAKLYFEASRDAVALAELLERIRIEWDNQGEKLIHPLATASMPDEIVEWRHKRLWEFRFLIRRYLDQMEKLKVTSKIAFPSDLQYFDVRKGLHEDAEALKQRGAATMTVLCDDGAEVL